MEKGRGKGTDTLQTDEVFTRKEYIEREAALQALCEAVHTKDSNIPCRNQLVSCLWTGTRTQEYAEKILAIPAADVVARDCYDRLLAENDDMRAIVDTYGGLENIQSAFVKLHEIETADVVPVVRCGECEYRKKARVNKKGFLICPASGMEITDNDYCSYGVLKDGDGDV